MIFRIENYELVRPSATDDLLVTFNWGAQARCFLHERGQLTFRLGVDGIRVVDGEVALAVLVDPPKGLFDELARRDRFYLCGMDQDGIAWADEVLAGAPA